MHKQKKKKSEIHSIS